MVTFAVVRFVLLIYEKGIGINMKNVYVSNYFLI